MQTLVTDRLTLRAVTLEDAPFVLEILNEPAFIRHVGDRAVRSEADAADYISRKFIASYEQFGFGFYLVELKGSRVPIGTCGLIKREVLEDVEIGYSFLEKYWGQGYAYEAALAVMKQGRNVLGLKRIVGLTGPGNQSSIKLLEKLGLRFDKMVYIPGYEEGSKLFT